MPFFPTIEKNYLTSDGDVVDNICWKYYGFTEKSTEAVFARNAFLPSFGPVLPAGLIITLPILSQDVLTAVLTKPLWNYTTRDVYTPSKQFYTSGQQEVTALETYRRQRDQAKRYAPVLHKDGGWLGDTQGTGGSTDSGGSGPSTDTPDPGPDTGTGSGGTVSSGCCGCNPRIVGDASWIAVFYQSSSGKWCLGRIEKTKLKSVGNGGYATNSTPLSLSNDPLGNLL